MTKPKVHHYFAIAANVKAKDATAIDHCMIFVVADKLPNGFKKGNVSLTKGGLPVTVKWAQAVSLGAAKVAVIKSNPLPGSWGDDDVVVTITDGSDNDSGPVDVIYFDDPPASFFKANGKAAASSGGKKGKRQEKGKGGSQPAESAG